MFELVSGIVIGLITGVIGNAIWDWIRDKISISSSIFTNVKGTWYIKSSCQLPDGSIVDFDEQLIITQQFRQRFRGTLISPHPTNQLETIKLDVRGEFKDKFHVVFSYENKSLTLTDMGAGTIQLNADHVTAVGASVNFGISSPREPAIIKFNMTKAK